MVYCTKCGAKNPDDAETCTQCGASLYPGRPPMRRSERRKHEEECFGIPRGGTIVGLGIGIIIVLAGISFLISELYNIEIPWWAFGVIMLGILIIVGALYGLRRY